MGRVFCVANQKGGVGKTTTALSLATALAMSGSRTLLVDLDPQCNASSGLGIEPTARHPLVTGEPLSDFIRPISGPLLLGNQEPRQEGLSAESLHAFEKHFDRLGTLEILPGCRSFGDVEALNQTAPERHARMTEQLTFEIKDYDYVLIDCPPSLGHLTRTALAWSTEVLMPIQCEYFAMEGLVQMIEVIRDIMAERQGTLQFGGIVLTMYDPTLELTLEIEREVRDFFGEIAYKTVVPRDVLLCEASSHGLSIFEYAPRSRGARAYTELCLEVQERV